MSTQIVGTAYLTTLQGICKIISAVSSFIAVLLVGINYYGDVINVFESAAAISIVLSVIFLILYASGAVENIPLSMNRVQFFCHVILAVYYIIACALVLDRGSHFTRIVVGGIIGFIAIVAHLIDAYDNYKKSPLC